MTSRDDILLRIEALRGLGANCGGDGGRLWILLNYYNKKVTRNNPHAISLVDLLGVRDTSMTTIFGQQWRGSFRNKKKGLGVGFTHREFSDAYYVTIGEDVGSDAPGKGNTIDRGSDIAVAIRHHIDKAVALAAEKDEAMKEDTEEEDTREADAVNEPENAETVAFNIRDYEPRLGALSVGCIPLAIERIVKRYGINGLYCTLREDILHCVFSTDGNRKRKAHCMDIESAVSYLEEEISRNGGEVPIQVQTFLHRAMQGLPTSTNHTKTLKYLDTANRVRSCDIQVAKKQRTCKPSATAKSRTDFITRLASSITDTMKQSLGNKYGRDVVSAVLSKCGEKFKLLLLDTDKTCLTYSELVAASLNCKHSVRSTCQFLQNLIQLRPDLSKLAFPTNLRKGMSSVINSGNLQFEHSELELVVSKKNHKSGLRNFWCLLNPHHQMEKLTESCIADGSFRNSNKFSKLTDAIVVVFGIDKAAENTGAAIRVANRQNGNSSDHTQLLAAVMNAAECHTNFIRTFFSDKCPLKHFLQSVVNDWYQSIVLRIGAECRCVTFTPLPRPNPCTPRHIVANVAQMHTCQSEDGDDIDWHDERLPPEVAAISGVVTVRLVRNSQGRYIGLQFLCNSTLAVLASVSFRESLNIPDEQQSALSSSLTIEVNQIVGFPAVDYKCSLCMAGIGGSSSSFCCTSCTRNKNNFGLPSEALQRYRDPNNEPTIKDATLRTGCDSVEECYKRGASFFGGGAINLSAADAKAVNDRNRSVVNQPCIDIHPCKNTGGPLHIAGGIMAHFIENITTVLKAIDERSEWWQSVLVAAEEIEALVENMKKNPQVSRILADNREMARKAIKLQEKVDTCQTALDNHRIIRRKSQEDDSEEDGNDDSGNGATCDVEQALVDNLNKVTKELQDAMKDCIDHATQTQLHHWNKKRYALEKLLPLIQSYKKSSNKRPRGKLENIFRVAIRAVGGKFLTQHGGSELTTDNGMDVFERFNEVEKYVVNVLPPDTDDGKLVRDSFKKYSKAAEKMMPMLRLLKRQDKCEDEEEVIQILDEFIRAWDEAFPGKQHFIKLHHLMHHVYDIIKRYGMYGILSEESMEALHKRINDLMSLSKSQTPSKRIAATNAKAQTLGKAGVANKLKIINEKSTGKSRKPYNINRPSQSVEAAGINSRYETVTHDGEEVAVTESGEGHLPLKYVEFHDLLAHGRVPGNWMETIYSSETLTESHKEQLSLWRGGVGQASRGPYSVEDSLLLLR